MSTPLLYKGVPARHPTAERILEAAMRLFAERGYSATTVGDIEQASGLSPRAGAFYKHFKSKEEVLAVALDRHVAAVEELFDVLDLLQLGDVRTELGLLARAALRELANESSLLVVLYREGGRFPELIGETHRRLTERAYSEITAWVERKVERGELPPIDAGAFAVAAFGSIVNFAIERALFGKALAGVDEDRFLEVWVDSWTLVAATLRREPEAE